MIRNIAITGLVVGAFAAAAAGHDGVALGLILSALLGALVED